MNKVKVIKEFPGIPVGTELTLNNGKYEYENNSHDTIVDFDYESYKSTSTSISLSSDTVKTYLGDFFEDITSYNVKSKEEIVKQLNRYKILFKKAKELEDETGMTVYQNLVWILEWILGINE